MTVCGGKGDINPTLADEPIDSAVPPSDGEGGVDNRDRKISTEPTVRQTRSGSKVVPENTPPLRRGQGRGRPKTVRPTTDEASGGTQQKEVSNPPATPVDTPVKKLSGDSDFSITLPPARPDSPLPTIPCRPQQAKKRPSATVSVQELKALMQVGRPARQ